RFVFSFQTEAGIRDFHVTGVQTCALPISCPFPLPGPDTDACHPGGSLLPTGPSRSRWLHRGHPVPCRKAPARNAVPDHPGGVRGSEERRVGDECRGGVVRLLQRDTYTILG